MRDTFPGGLLAATLLVAACGGGDEAGEAPVRPDGPAAGASPGTQPSPTPAATVPAWDLQASGEGTALVYPAGGDAQIRLFCPSGSDRLLVNVPAFRPIGSEERLTFGSGGEAHALVADTRGDRQRGGVSATGAVPANLEALIAGPLSAVYGAQRSGPHPEVPAGLAGSFLAACREAAPAPTPADNVSACLVQDGRRLTVTPLRAIGTEPFWGARIEGRCVTYSHPEDQDGTRVWTRYAAREGGGGTWTGALEGSPFVLTTRPQPGCSDGMSDNRYPLAVELTVGGEERRGCAGPR